MRMCEPLNLGDLGIGILAGIVGFLVIYFGNFFWILIEDFWEYHKRDIRHWLGEKKNELKTFLKYGW